MRLSVCTGGGSNEIQQRGAPKRVRTVRYAFRDSIYHLVNDMHVFARDHYALSILVSLRDKFDLNYVIFSAPRRSFDNCTLLLLRTTDSELNR